MVLYELGRPLRLNSESIGQVIMAPRPGQIHSKKPPEAMDRIENLFMPNVSRIELFARNSRDGWDSWGNQV